MDNKKDLIIIHHIPVDGLTRQNMHETISGYRKAFYTGDFFQEYFLPYTEGNPKKVIIEIINLKDNKTTKVIKKLNEIDENIMKHFEYDKWLRLKKLRNILKLEVNL